MSQDKKIEQQGFSPEINRTPEKPTEETMDSSKTVEQAVEKETKILEKESDHTSRQAPVLSDEHGTSVNVSNDVEVVHKKVENVLAEDMDSIYLSLDAGTQKAFKIKGEEVAQKITRLLLNAKARFKEVSKLILEWLRIIPKVNKHYIEQEAKIKTEKILKINNE